MSDPMVRIVVLHADLAEIILALRAQATAQQTHAILAGDPCAGRRALKLDVIAGQLSRIKQESEPT